jgi:hypothetical protein
MRPRVGKTETFIEKTRAILFSGRKTFETRATYASTLLLGTISGIGALTTIATPAMVGQKAGADQYITAAAFTVACYGMMKQARYMSKHHWVREVK